MGPDRRRDGFKLPFDELLRLVLETPRRRPVPGLPRRLDALFRELARPEPARPADEVEDLIWALWISHADDEAAEAMGRAVDALAAGELEQARPLLDALVAEHPGWAEAWNKRATLAFVQQRDLDALSDIERTLELEPRHFGAVAGYGQICLRHGRVAEARAAFQIALAINPHLHGLRMLLDELKPDLETLH